MTRTGDQLVTDYDYKNNGRGPTINESIRLNSAGYPIQWEINGNTTFGNKIDEYFQLEGQQATWQDATGNGATTISDDAFYIDQSGTPYSIFLAAQVLLKAEDHTVPALPAGHLQLTEMESLESSAANETITLKSYALSGAGLNPTYFILDEANAFFAFMTPRFIVIRSGHEDEEARLRQLAETYSAQRFENLQAKFAHKYSQDWRIRNVKIFDPKSLALTELVSVLVADGKIKSIDSPDVVSANNEIEIDGDGGTLVAGLYEMHGHMGVNSALLNVIAGVTSVRDMGNSNDVLANLIDDIESGVLAGPRITRLGMIEGKSPFNNNNGYLVENEAQALEAVQAYADQGFYGVKLYNSMNGDWAPAIVKKAHELNLHVAGHVPAFSNANAMIKAGYDEMTHINQVMLGWVLEPEEDTRTLLRLTALQRLPELDLNSTAVQETLDLMVKNNTAIDPTLAIHEALLLSRNGSTSEGVLDYIEHMPANVQRNAKVAWASIANDQEDLAYRLAYDKIIATLKLMKERGIFLVAGTDLGGAFTMHRELELYQQLGYTPAELLKLASYDMAQYLGHKDRGAIEPGHLADFFLIPNDPTKDLKAIKTISMVSRGGVLYFPSEIYPEFGIKPFVESPKIKQ
ncbi:amidohydrolase family protein [Marinicella litoralis]|uniref:amidohydrolase family protein n=1 Tax=Marinicella litoralis TaxID=644220 RepID=UPI001B86D757|nr:amidohydrolase family protein [Marinicella litoralis]